MTGAQDRNAQVRKTILIVEDDRSIAETLQFTLHAEGYATVLAEDGTRALEVLQQVQVDLVLTDLNMSPMHGRDFLKAKLANPNFRSLPAIVVSAERSLEAIPGAFSVIPKPFSIDTLVEAIRSALYGATKQ